MHPFFQLFNGFFPFELFRQMSVEPVSLPSEDVAAPEATDETSALVTFGKLDDEQIFKMKQIEVLHQEAHTIRDEMAKVMEPFQRRMMVANSRHQTASIEFGAMLSERVGVSMNTTILVSEDHQILVQRAAADAAGVTGQAYNA